VRGQDYRSDRALEVGHRDLGVEDIDAALVPGVFSFTEDTVHGAQGFKRPHFLTGVVLYREGAGTVRESV
jgi:hypothetical protein